MSRLPSRLRLVENSCTAGDGIFSRQATTGALAGCSSATPAAPSDTGALRLRGAVQTRRSGTLMKGTLKLGAPSAQIGKTQRKLFAHLVDSEAYISATPAVARRR